VVTATVIRSWNLTLGIMLSQRLSISAVI